MLPIKALLLVIIGLSSFGDSSPVQMKDENYNGTNLPLPYNRNTNEGVFSYITDIEIRRFTRNTTHLAKSRRKRSSTLTSMIQCGPPADCGRKYLSWYGNYCGPGGSGKPVDDIDRCCQVHDACYDNCSCRRWEYWFAQYDWECYSDGPYCYESQDDSCRKQLCECDRKFVECLNWEASIKHRWLCSSYDFFLKAHNWLG